MLRPADVVQWLQMRLNRPPRKPLDESAFWSLFELDGQPLSAAPAALEQPGETELLAIVTTFRRPTSCMRVLDSLARAFERSGLASARVLVLHDRSTDDYRATRERAQMLFGERVLWLDARAHLGKAGYWQTYQTSFLAARALRPRFALYLQDDLQFEPDLLANALAFYRATDNDPQRRVIYLYASREDERHGRWIRFERRAAGAGLALTQWFDLQAFFTDRAFFELLGYRMIPIHPNRWRRRPSISSGVGRQLTIRLRGRANVYQTFPPLVFHGSEKSEMNPTARAEVPLDNRALRVGPPARTDRPKRQR